MYKTYILFWKKTSKSLTLKLKLYLKVIVNNIYKIIQNKMTRMPILTITTKCYEK